jgi:hypothetical protein
MVEFVLTLKPMLMLVLGTLRTSLLFWRCQVLAGDHLCVVAVDPERFRLLPARPGIKIVVRGLRLAALLVASSTAAHAEAGCAPAISTAEQANADLPAHILRAIGVVETGRRDPVSGQIDAWPWSVNAAGDSHAFASRDQAIAFVRDAQARGIRSIDVGCMQINLMSHPNAFASLEEAFTPEANVRYAAGFLLDLRQRTGDWTTATGDYHSATPGRSESYARRVQAILTGQQSDAGRLDSVGSRIWPASVLRPLPVVWTSVMTRRVQVVEPGTVPVRLGLLRGPSNLPHVYYP